MFRAFFGNKLNAMASFIAGCIRKRVYPPINTINFNANILCPPQLPVASYQEWVDAYLLNLEPHNLLLWANEEHVLQIAFRDKNNSIRHCQLREFQVSPETKKIFKNQLALCTIEEIEQYAKANNCKLPRDITIPSSEQLTAQKYKVFLYKEIVTQEMINKSIASARQQQDNIELCAECSICTDTYTKKNPPITLMYSGQIYHKDCILQCFTEQKRQNIPLTDPLTNTVVAQYSSLNSSDYRNPVRLVTSAKGYESCLKDSKALLTELMDSHKMLNILNEKNKMQERKMALLQTTVDKNSPQPKRMS